ncbi:methylenetetrahydrofolate reductase [Sciscionella marina]|uniref:methylenetetrahydrofolate reductase n=1 Tax=Sciscionella marina TaxID=508770 RepID=UPI000361EFEC|nr:methylenetetrahydrofolate reductase [Sciscionella marina]
MTESLTRAGKRRVQAALLAAPRYEVMPLRGALDKAAELPPGATVTVTSSPSRGVLETIELAESLGALGFDAVPHLAARLVTDGAELADLLDRIAAAGIRDVFVVGGDGARPLGEFENGLDLLRAMAELGKRPPRVGVPSYPDGHHAMSFTGMLDALEAKQEYADYTVTQLCFDADLVCRFAESARSRGIRLPIIAGVPGVVDPRKLLRVSMRIGVGDSVRFVRGNRSVAGKLLRPGGYRPDSLVRKLGAHGAITGLHVYTFNHIGPTVRWLTARRRAVA